MKTKFIKFALPVGIGLMLMTITIFGLVSTTFTSCSKTKHCTNTAYPLWCPSVGKCCTAGHAYWCDGNCYSSGCPSGTISRDNCVPE